MAGKLYVVGTPIGNLEDFSPRAIRILSQVDFIAAEDTRVTMKLLNHFELRGELVSYFEHNKKEKGPQIIERLLSGETGAIVTDAGMPAVSDPGEDLVRLAHENGIAVESVPGPSAFVTALAISGMPSRRFCFEGFLPVEKAERRERLLELQTERRTVILYEAPHKLLTTLQDLTDTLGDREIAVTKELTKIHETVFRMTLSQAVAYFRETPPKGEYVLIVRGAPEQTETYTPQQAVELARRLMADGESTSAAAKEAAKVTGIKKGEIYTALINLEKNS